MVQRHFGELLITISADIISMEDGKQGLEELLVTRIFTWELSISNSCTQKEAAEAYDIAAIKFCGVNAVTNFEISKYDVKSLLESSTLPIGGAVRRLKDAENAEMALDIQRKANNGNHNSHLTNGLYKIMDALIPYHFILNYSPQSTSTRSIKYLQRQYI